MHKKTKRLDRAGRGNFSKFWYLSQQHLLDTIEFEPMNNYMVAAGGVWRHLGCIPMGGSFSAQFADLHCQWGSPRNSTFSAWVSCKSPTVVLYPWSLLGATSPDANSR